MSFGKSMISVVFNQKTIKVGLHVRVNYVIPPWNKHGKVPEDSRGLHTLKAQGLYNQTLPHWGIKSFEKIETLNILGAPLYYRA
jgi:hypothetical protein